MKASWVAGVTRCRLMLGRVIGPDHARTVAASGSLADAVGVLAGSAYGERVRGDLDLAGAERAVADTLLWHLRVLAGWLPGGGASVIRALAAWFELANIDARVAALLGDGREPAPFVLGGLATAWSRIEQSRSLDQVAEIVATSAWGDPGGRSPAELALGLRVAWARRVRASAPEAERWVAGAAALLVAREVLLAAGRPRRVQLRRLPWIGDDALGAGSVRDLRAALPAESAWALDATREVSELWRAELAWWRRIEHEAAALLRGVSDEGVVLAAVALLAADAARTARALRVAAAGGTTELIELVDGAL